MRAVLGALTSPFVVVVFLAVVFSLCVWVFAPFVGNEAFRPFAGPVARLVTILSLWLVALLLILVIYLRRQTSEKALEDDIVKAPEAAGAGADPAVKAELEALRTKLRAAISAMRKSRKGRRSLYELPWYVIIGPPGAGKTTAIVNSGLRFPLAEGGAKASVGGVGGTRNCDWWFATDAVLIDTAGRYTTQDSNAGADNAAWTGFLKLLRRHRPRQPVNGAIVAISLSDLSQQDEISQAGHARAVRRRLDELRELLGVRVPVYVLFTKADLLAGFMEFFDRLGKEEREQVWGFTLPLGPGGTRDEALEGFDREFADLLGRVNAQSLERLQEETDPERRSLVAGFPAQFASVRAVARGFLSEVMEDSRFEHRQMLRGVYFTCGTQEGTPIDRLMVSMAQTFGIGRQAIGSGRGTGKTFFLKGLFERVIFPEAGLVSSDDRVETRYRWTRRAAIAATLIAVLGTGLMWGRSFVGNRGLIADAGEAAALYRTAAAAIPPSPVGDSDLPGLVGPLDILRGLPGNPGAPAPGDGTVLRYGLYQGGVVGNEARIAYRDALNRHMLPRLLLRLEEQMQRNIDNTDFLYEALKIYLMLGQKGPMNADLVKEWLRLDWSLRYPGETNAALRAALDGHLENLLEEPMLAIDLNGPMVAQVQSLLASLPLAERIYKGIINSPRAAELPPFRIPDAGGPATARAMVRSSGVALEEGIEGIYTNRGFNTVFLIEALSVSRRLQGEAWVLGEAAARAQADGSLLEISRDVLNLYYNDFIARYEAILADLDVVPVDSLSHAVDVTNLLSGPSSPIRGILEAVAAETRLTGYQPPGAGAAADAAAAVGGAAGSLASTTDPQTLAVYQALTGSAPEGGASPVLDRRPPGSVVEDRFAWLEDLVAAEEGSPSKLDLIVGSLTEVYQEMNRVAFTGQNTSEALNLALANLQQAAARHPDPLARWARQIAAGSSGISAQGARAAINAIWQSQILPFCAQATEARYPFDRRSPADMSMQDFQRLFAPGGLIDGFFSQHLQPFVDMRAQPWTWKPQNGADPGFSPAALEEIQRAAEIRDAFFGAGPAPAVQFQVTPSALDPKATHVRLIVDGEAIIFSHENNQPTPKAFTWPGSVGSASVTFAPDQPNMESGLRIDGPWAWFRLLNAAEIRTTNVPDRKRVIFNVSGRIAIFQLQSSSVANPFNLAALGKFSCPSSF